MLKLIDKVSRFKTVEIKENADDDNPSKAVIKKYGTEGKFIIQALASAYYSCFANLNISEFMSLNTELQELQKEIEGKRDEDVSIETKNRLEIIVRKLGDSFKLKEGIKTKYVAECEYELLKARFDYGLETIDGLKVDFSAIENEFAKRQILDAINEFNNESDVEEVKKN
jgi:hypothetical protein